MNDRSRKRRLVASLLAAVALLLVAAGITVGLNAGRGVPVAPAASASAPVTALAAEAPGTEPLPSGTPVPPSTGPATDPPGGDVASASPPSNARVAGPERSGSPSAPVSLDIPAIGVAESTLSTLGLNPDETVEVPTDFDRAGWFALGPTPGESGAAVILGHVDSTTGPAVFFRLGALAPGDRIEVGLADGRVARFVVDSVETFEKQAFPAERVYTSDGSPDLQLVTCGGEFDRATGHYLSNVVVFTSFTDMLPA